MRINSLYISAFGGIKNLKLDFEDGFNVIYGDNENGKSTVMAFIKMMFYGSDRGTAKLSKNTRKKYTPWDSSSMAGSIDFTFDGRNYRLEREFRSSNSTDKVTLCDLDFGTRQAVGADVGLKFFGLSAAAFERSVFIGQFGFPENDSAAEGEINSKLSNMVLTGDESVSFETVNSRLEKAKLSLMSKSGKAGEYDKNVIHCNTLCAKLETLEELKAECERKKSDINRAEEKIASMNEKAQEIKRYLAAENDLRNAEKLREFLDLKEKLDDLNRELTLSDGSLADEMYLGKLKFCITKVQNAKLQKQAKIQEINTIEKGLEAGLNPPEDATEENAERLQLKIEELKKGKAACEEKATSVKLRLEHLKNTKTDSNLWIILLLGTIASGILAGVFGFITEGMLLPLIAAAVAAVLLCSMVAVLASLSKKKAERQEKIVNLEAEAVSLEAHIKKFNDEIFTKKVTLEAINSALNSSAAVIERQKEMLALAKEELHAAEAEEAEALKPLLQLFSLYKNARSLEEILQLMEEIAAKSAKQKELKQQLNFISRNIGSVSYEEAKQKLESVQKGGVSEVYDFEELKKTYENLNSDITDAKAAVAAARASLRIESKTEEIPAIKNEIEALHEKIAEQKEFCGALDIAAEVLRESFAEVRRSYGSVLERKAGEIFALLTDNRYEGMSISKSFDINVNEKDIFGSREIDYLSSGTADQAYLSLRLALAQLMCEGKESLPVMLDDTLTQYDDGRMGAAVKYLKEYSESSQIIMFTCHKNVSDAAFETGANAINL